MLAMELFSLKLLAKFVTLKPYSNSKYMSFEALITTYGLEDQNSLL